MSATTPQARNPLRSPPPPIAGTLRWARGAFATSVLLVIAKFGLFAATGSSAILSDALESIVNVGTGLFMLYAVRLAAQPRDEDHPYGHGKVEYLAAGLEGFLMVFAGLAVGVVAISRAHQVEPISRIDAGVIGTFAIALFTLIAGVLVERAGRRAESISLESDGQHLKADAITSLAVGTGLVLVWVTGLRLFDTLTAVGVASWLVFAGARILRRSLAGLMDEAMPEILHVIADELEALREPGWVAPHHAKVHRLGQAIHIDIHLVFPRFWTIERTHACAERVEAALKERFGPRTDVMVHQEPCTPRSCSYCDLEACPVRGFPFAARNPWTGSSIARTRRP